MAWTILSSFTLQTPRNVARRDTVMATCELRREEARSRDARVSSAASAAVSSGSISMLDTVPDRHQGTTKPQPGRSPRNAPTKNATTKSRKHEARTKNVPHGFLRGFVSSWQKVQQP